MTKIVTIQSFWFREIVNNSSFNRNRYQVIERHLNVEFNFHMSYNNASWFWKIEHALNVFKNQLFSFTVSDSRLVVNEFAIKFHDRNSNKFRLTHKSAKKSFVLYVLINEKTFYMILCCEIHATILSITNKISRSIYFQESRENAKRALLRLLQWRCIFHLQKKWYTRFASELHTIFDIFILFSFWTIFSRILISSELCWLSILMFVISYESMHLIYLIERSMSDYHSLLWNLVILVRYMQLKHKKCANVKTLNSIDRFIQLNSDCSICRAHLRRLYFQHSFTAIACVFCSVF